MAASAAATTFVRTPSRPACTAATTPASASLSSTGTQSATSTHSTRPRVVVTRASVSGTGASDGPSTTATPLPCTCVIQTSASPGTPSSRASRSRLAATSAGASPTCAPRLNESYGGADRPPRRSVTTLRGRTADGAAGTGFTNMTLPGLARCWHGPAAGSRAELARRGGSTVLSVPEELRDVELLLEVLAGQRPPAAP